IYRRDRAARSEQARSRQQVAAADMLNLEEELVHTSGCQQATPPSNGGMTAHASSALGQRFLKGQPGGNSPIPGTDPGMVGNFRLGTSSSSKGGMASINARVYGWRGFVKTTSASPDSTMWPPYSTRTRWHTLATTGRSWVI